MNGFKILCCLIAVLCVALIIAACIIGNAAWYLWIISLGLIGWMTCSEWPKNKFEIHEQHILCARAGYLNACIVSWIVLWLELSPHVLVGIVAILWALTGLWICSVHLFDNKGKFFWWLGLSVTALGVLCTAVTILSDNLGHALPANISGGMVLFTVGVFFLTLIIGFVLYVYPLIKDIVADIRDIRRIIKGTPHHDDD